MDHVRKAFGEEADLYEVLGLKDRDDVENPAKLRKAYFRKALVWHPDKTKEKDAELAKEKFQAISFAYEILKNPAKRSEYNETGHVDEGDADDDSNDGARKDWKEYFDRIFGKVTTSKIDQFALKYKCSEEEQRDVMKEYKKFKGDLVKMLEYVMLSEPRDAKRWVDDYITPAIQAKDVPDYSDKIEASMKKIDKKIEAENKKKSKSKKAKGNKKPESDEESEDEEMSDGDSEATETESVEEAPPVKNKKKSNEKVAAKKGKPTKAKVAKKRGKGNKEEDLYAMIQANKAKRSGDLPANLGARYGVQMDDEDDDPMNDKEFEAIQQRMAKKKKAR